VLAKAGPGIRFNEHLDYDDGAAVFQHACKMGVVNGTSALDGRTSLHRRLCKSLVKPQ
jgi:hypothetical protein